jgi:putative aldouronate transport system substrate-binding protein
MEKGKRKVALLAIAAVVAATGCNQANNGNANEPNQGTATTTDGETSGENATVKLSVASMPKYPPNEIPNDYVK